MHIENILIIILTLFSKLLSSSQSKSSYCVITFSDTYKPPIDLSSNKTNAFFFKILFLILSFFYLTNFLNFFKWPSCLFGSIVYDWKYKERKFFMSFYKQDI